MRDIPILSCWQYSTVIQSSRNISRDQSYWRFQQFRLYPVVLRNGRRLFSTAVCVRLIKTSIIFHNAEYPSRAAKNWHNWNLSINLFIYHDILNWWYHSGWVHSDWYFRCPISTALRHAKWYRCSVRQNLITRVLKKSYGYEKFHISPPSRKTGNQITVRSASSQ